MKKALLIIDMQVMPFIWKDYGGKRLFNEEALLANSGRLIAKARQANAPIYYVMYTEGAGSPRAEGQPLWQVHPALTPQEGDHILVKYHADSFLKTSLATSLHQQGVRELVLCGVQTEFCVDTTCKSAFAHGFGVELAADGHSTYDSDLLPAETIIAHHNHILTQFARIRSAAEIEMG